jgi:hypothetical protein
LRLILIITLRPEKLSLPQAAEHVDEDEEPYNNEKTS